MVWLTDQVTEGLGDPLMGTEKLMVLPAQTTRSWRAERSIQGLTKRASAVMGSEGSLGTLSPASLTAMIRNWYSVPSVRPVTVPTGLGPGHSAATSQMPNLVFFSMIHFLILLPPSDYGTIYI